MLAIVFVLSVIGAVSSAVRAVDLRDQAAVAFSGLFSLSALVSLYECFRVY